MTTAVDYNLGCKLSVDNWVWLNRTGAFQNANLHKFVCSFPPSKLMYSVSGLTNEPDFASHGADLFLVLSQASPVLLLNTKNCWTLGVAAIGSRECSRTIPTHYLAATHGMWIGLTRT